MINPTEIDHTVLRVRDLAATEAYLCSLFLFNAFIHPNSKNTVAIEGEGVHFFLELAEEGADLSCQHISFKVTDIESVELFLTKRGIAFKRGTFNGFNKNNYQWIEWLDPQGIRLECVQLI